MEACNFSSSALITTIHSKNRMDKSVTTTKTLAQSLFSIETETSKVTDSDNEDKDSNAETDKDDGQDGQGAIAIEGMKIMSRGIEWDGGEAETPSTDLDSATKAAKSNALSSAMRNATDNLKLHLNSDGTDSSGETTKEAKHVNPYMDDEEGEAYNTAEESVGEDSDMNISKDYKSDVTEVSSGEFEASFSKKYKDPKDFKQELWNNVGPSPESMIVYINLLRKELEDSTADLPFNVTSFGRLYKLLVDESRTDYRDNLRFLDSIKEDIAAFAGLDDQDDPLLEIRSPNNNPAQDNTAAPVCDWATKVICSRQGLIPVQCQLSNCNKPLHHLCQITWENMISVKEEGCATYCRQHNKFWRDHQASKTHGSLPGAQLTSYTGGAVTKPANAAGGDKEGEQSRSMASSG
jgi:hypothetical protein